MEFNKNNFIVGVCDKYTEELLKKRVEIEGNTIGCIAGDLLLLDDSSLTSKDYITKDGRFLFSMLKGLRDRGCTIVDEVTLLTNVTDEVKEKLESIGGWKQLQSLIDICNVKNFDVFLDDLRKSNICLKLYEKGFNLLNKMTLENGKIQIVNPIIHGTHCFHLIILAMCLL